MPAGYPSKGATLGGDVGSLTLMDVTDYGYGH